MWLRQPHLPMYLYFLILYINSFLLVYFSDSVSYGSIPIGSTGSTRGLTSIGYNQGLVMVIGSLNNSLLLLRSAVLNRFFAYASLPSHNKKRHPYPYTCIFLLLSIPSQVSESLHFHLSFTQLASSPDHSTEMTFTK